MLIRDTVSLKVEHCKFMYNNGMRPYLGGRNTLNFSTQNSGGIALLYDGFSSGEAHIENCVFINCSANALLPESSHLPYSYVPFGHGGGLLIFFNNPSSIIVSVSDSMFINCTAHHSGGAITVSMINSPKNNLVVIRNTSFTNCHAEKTGGGLSVQVMKRKWLL